MSPFSIRFNAACGGGSTTTRSPGWSLSTGLYRKGIHEVDGKCSQIDKNFRTLNKFSRFRAEKPNLTYLTLKTVQATRVDFWCINGTTTNLWIAVRSVWDYTMANEVKFSKYLAQTVYRWYDVRAVFTFTSESCGNVWHIEVSRWCKQCNALKVSIRCSICVQTDVELWVHWGARVVQIVYIQESVQKWCDLCTVRPRVVGTL